MAAEPWPSDIPACFRVDSLSSGLGDGRIRFTADAGPAKVRRRSSAVPSPLSGQLVLTYAQLESLEDFVAGPLQGGALPFSFPDQRGGDDILVRFAEGDPLIPWKRHGAGHVLVDLRLEVLP